MEHQSSNLEFPGKAFQALPYKKHWPPSLILKIQLLNVFCGEDFINFIILSVTTSPLIIWINWLSFIFFFFRLIPSKCVLLWVFVIPRRARKLMPSLSQALYLWRITWKQSSHQSLLLQNPNTLSSNPSLSRLLLNVYCVNLLWKNLTVYYRRMPPRYGNM